MNVLEKINMYAILKKNHEGDIMKRSVRLLSLLLGVCMILTMTSCQLGERKKPKKNKTYEVFFIGNSYTYCNDLPAIFKSIAEEDGYEVNITSVLSGGYTLTSFANPEDPKGQEVKAAFESKEFDFVIIQEQSQRPVLDPAKFFEGARSIVKMVRKNGAVPIFYSTWGRREGEASLNQLMWTNESMTWDLAASYSAIAKELDAEVAHVGLGFYDVYTSSADINLYDKDGSHPSVEGSYLAAYILYSRVFMANPKDLTYNGLLKDEDAVILKEAAYRAVYETPEIPAEYVREAF